MKKQLEEQPRLTGSYTSNRLWKKRLTGPQGKKILCIKSSPPPHVLAWLEDWIENLVQSRCLPPQLAAANFLDVLSGLLSVSEMASVLEDLRSQYQTRYGEVKKPTVEECEYVDPLSLLHQ